MDLAAITQQLNADKAALSIELEKFVAKQKKQRAEHHALFVKKFNLDATSDMTSPEFFATLDVMAEISGNLEDALWMAGFDGETGSNWLNKSEAPPMNRRRDTLRMLLHGVMEKYTGDRLNLDIANCLNVIEDESEKVVSITVFSGQAKPSEPNYPPLDTNLDDVREFNELPTITWNALRRGGFYYFGDLLFHTEAEMRRVRKLGANGMDHIKMCLSNLGCYLGMNDFPDEVRDKYRNNRKVRDWFLNRGCITIKVLVQNEMEDWQDFVAACERFQIYKYRDLMTAQPSIIGTILGDNDRWVTVVTNLSRSKEVPGFKLGMTWPVEVSLVEG